MRLELGFCVGLYSDGTAAMAGKHSGLVTQFKELVPQCKSTYHFLHPESFATKVSGTKHRKFVALKFLSYIER